MELLKKLYELHAPSGREQKMTHFVWEYCLLSGARVVEENGNLYVTKGSADTYPCVVAHLDQVQEYPCIAHQVGKLMVGLRKDGLGFAGLGADDKNGIWIALKCLKHFDAIRLAFFCQEETGCIGSFLADLTFFGDCRFVIECDRPGGRDFVHFIKEEPLCGEEFIRDVDPETFGFRKAFGLGTDVWILRRRALKTCCCNISCGYYNPHTVMEFTVLPELENTLAFVKNIIQNCTKTYRITKEEFKKEWMAQRNTNKIN